jgi:hypothetical protein
VTRIAFELVAIIEGNPESAFIVSMAICAPETGLGAWIIAHQALGPFHRKLL